MEMAFAKRTDPEQVFCYFKNNEATDLVDGDVVLIDTAAAAADLGNAVVGSGTAGGELNPAGVVSGKNIPPGDFGRVMVYGVHNNVKAVAASVKLPMQTHTVAKTMATGTTAGAYMGFSISVAAGGRAKIFLKCM